MIVFTNARVFDGANDGLVTTSVTVDGDRITAVSDAPAPPDAQVIDVTVRASPATQLGPPRPSTTASGT